jgi:hypothetical protein
MPPMVGAKRYKEGLAGFLNANANPPASGGQNPVRTVQK